MTVVGGDGRDTGIGNDGGDVISTLGGDDTLNGGAGDDVLFGGDGNDIIYGGLGNDALFGGDGNDTLYPGRGSNALHGGKGEDTYTIEYLEGVHTITDFDNSEDNIQINAQEYRLIESIASAGLNTQVEIILSDNGSPKGSIIVYNNTIEDIASRIEKLM